jgi:hypothetical protein
MASPMPPLHTMSRRPRQSRGATVLGGGTARSGLVARAQTRERTRADAVGSASGLATACAFWTAARLSYAWANHGRCGAIGLRNPPPRRRGLELSAQR